MKTNLYNRAIDICTSSDELIFHMRTLILTIIESKDYAAYPSGQALTASANVFVDYIIKHVASENN